MSRMRKLRCVGLSPIFLSFFLAFLHFCIFAFLHFSVFALYECKEHKMDHAIDLEIVGGVRNASVVDQKRTSRSASQLILCYIWVKVLKWPFKNLRKIVAYLVCFKRATYAHRLLPIYYLKSLFRSLLLRRKVMTPSFLGQAPYIDSLATKVPIQSNGYVVQRRGQSSIWDDIMEPL